MNPLLVSPWISANLERLGWTLAHFLWQGALAAALLAVGLAALRRASAQLRYLAGVAAAAAALLMPLMTFALLRPAVARRVATPDVPTVVASGPTTSPKGGQGTTAFAGLTAADAGQAAAATAKPAGARSPRREQGGPGWGRRLPELAARLRAVLPWCGFLWMLGVFALSVRLLAGWTQAQRLCRRGTHALEARWQARLERLARRMGVRRAVRLLASTVAEVPAVIGALRPVVLLPVGMLTGLSAAQVEMILAHELAHVRRQDYLVNLGLILFETLGFYHPAVWWIAARVREEREHACDDLAVQATGDDRIGYARALATLEEMRGMAGGVALAANSGGRGTLLARVRRLLGVVPERKTGDRRNVGWLAGVLALLVTGMSTLGSFQPPAHAQTEVKPAAATAAAPIPTAAPTPAVEMLTARVKVVDDTGQPIAGATVTPDGLRPRGNSGGHYLWPTKELGPPAPATTDAAGIATVRYPRFLTDGLATGAISFRAQHPDYCAVRPTDYRIGNPDKLEPVTLRRGAALRVSGHLPGSAAVPVYPQQDDPTHSSLAPDDWKDAGGNALETHGLPAGRNYVRLAHAAADGRLFFSETKLLNAVPGQAYTLDLELSPGVRVEGRLDDSVARPVRGGKVVVRAYATAPESDANWIDWNSWRAVAADGTFVFESLPPGRLEAVVRCEGYTSAGLPDTEFNGMHNIPQHFELLPGKPVPAEIKMQAAAACTVQVRDASGAPVSGVRVGFAPNVRWTPGLTTIFGLAIFRMEDFVASRPRKWPALDWRTINPFQAVSDARGNATVGNLPAVRETGFGVIDEHYESLRPNGTVRPASDGDERVNLVPGETANVTVRVGRKDAAPRPDEPTADTPEPAPAAAAPTPRRRSPGELSPADVQLAVRPFPTEPGTFSGRVVDEAGKGLAGVLVDAWTWCPGSETTTDADGNFRLAGLELSRRIEVRFSKEGYVPRLVAKQPLGALEQPLTLTTQTYFEGIVTDPDGQPAAGAFIRANQGPKQADGVLIDTVWTETHADAQGRYRLYAQDDRYDIQVTTRAGNVARLPEVELAGGEARHLDITLRPGVVFRAKVVDSTGGAPVAGTRLSNWQRPGVEGVSGPDGTLEIRGLPPGEFEFQVESPGFTHWWSEQCADAWSRFQPESDPGNHWQRNFDALDFDLQPGMPPVTVTLERGVRVRGRALDPEGKPVGGATVTVAHTGNSLAGDTRFSVSTRADGAFDLLLPASKESEYNLEVHDGKYGEWRRWANGVLPPIRTQPGQEINGVEIRLRRPAIVRGRALDKAGDPVVGQNVQASAADKLENRYYDPQATTDREGRFELKFVRPGKQTVRLEVAQEGGYLAPTAEQTVDLPEDGSLDIELREKDQSDPAETAAATPAPAASPDQEAEVRGLIRDAAGHPVAYAGIVPFGIVKGESTAYCPMRGKIDERATTDAGGEFILRHADAAGTFIARVGAPDFARKVFNGLKVGPGGQTLVLEREAVLTGQVLTTAGVPAAGVRLMLVQNDRNTATFLGTYEATTDPQGRFRFGEVGPGLRYDLFGLMTPAAPGDLLPTRGIVAGKAGDQQDVGSCRLQPGHQISGQVQLADGAPLPAGSTLTLSREHAWDMQRFDLPPDGRFDFRGVPSEAVRFTARVPGYDNLMERTQESLRDQSYVLEDSPSSFLRDVATYERSGQNWQLQVAGDQSGVTLLLHANAAIERWLATQPADWVQRVEADYPDGTAGLSRAELRQLARQAQTMVGTPETGLDPRLPVTWRFVLGSKQEPALVEIARRAKDLGVEALAPRHLRDIEELAGLSPDLLDPNDPDHPMMGLEMRFTEPPSAEKFFEHELALRRLMQGDASVSWRMSGRVTRKDL